MYCEFRLAIIIIITAQEQNNTIKMNNGKSYSRGTFFGIVEGRKENMNVKTTRNIYYSTQYI